MTPLKLVNANFICILHFLFQVCYVEMSYNLLIKTISNIPLTHMINIGAGGNNITITKSCKNQNIVLLCCNQHVFFVFRQINNDSIFYRISIKVFLGLPLVRFIDDLPNQFRLCLGYMIIYSQNFTFIHLMTHLN